MKYASVCDGIGAAHAAWNPLGWQCEWTSEIEPFPATVVEQRWGFKNLGDMTKLKEEMIDAPVELLVGGTPCQSFSVAGLRKGLDDPRGNLALRFVQIAAVVQPKWIVWENVPGVLSSGGGRDFGTFLGALAELGYGFAYRVLDAQWFGVAQRRRRVFVVGHFGDWRRAAAVLFEPESVFGNPPSRSQAGKGTSGGVAKSLRGRSNASHRGESANAESYVDLAGTQITHRSQKGGIVAFHPTQDPISNADGSTHSMGCGSKQGCATVAVAFQQNTRDEVRQINGDGSIVGALAASSGMKQTNYVAFSAKDHGGDATVNVAPTMRSMGHDGSHANGGGQLAVAFDTTQVTSPANYSNPKPGDPCQLLAAEAHVPAVAFKESQSGCRVGEVHATLDANKGSRRMEGALLPSMSVRRLTPRECERLQGFPDDYTLVTYRGKPAADGPRYKALGNSMAVPVMRWIGARIKKVEGVT